MKLSDRISNIVQDGSDGWEVFIRARAMKAAGMDVLELSIGEHDKKTDPTILNAMDASTRSGNTGYAEVPGSSRLRQAIARRIEAQTGVTTTKENVIVTAGGQAALFAAHQAVLDPGDTALYCDPYYATYPGTLRACGARDVAIPTRPRDDFQPQVAEIEKHAGQARSLLINSPNNPSGVVYSKDTLQGIASVCQRHDLWLISDEVYDTQVWEGEHHSPRALPGMAERTLVIGSMSKSHAMTGFRCGWIIGPEAVIANLINLATVNTYGVAGFIQDASYFALTEGQDIEREVAEVFRVRRQLARDALNGANAVRLIPSGGAMYLMLDIRSTGMTGIEFANRLLDDEQIAVMPGESFGKSAAGHIRVAMTLADDRFVQALGRLAEFAQKYART
jgi:arginine:pyruvate transaminase